MRKNLKEQPEWLKVLRKKEVKSIWIKWMLHIPKPWRGLSDFFRSTVVTRLYKKNYSLYERRQK